jgi:nucleoside-diphosphate-sugar epimerase
LRDRKAITDLVHRVRPDAVMHLAAVIPPATYQSSAVSREVNVDAVEHLVGAIAKLENPCRLIHASSMAVYGSRNPYSHPDLATASTHARPCELYGAQKLEAEDLIRASSIDWTILRLGGVFFHDLGLSGDRAQVKLEAILPTDGRCHAVDARDVARAFVNAIDAECRGKVLLIGGDSTNLLRQNEFTRGLTSALGLRGALPRGRKGDPADDDGWFHVDWLDTSEAEKILRFQKHTWPESLRDMARHAGARRHLRLLLVPLVRLVLWSTSPLRGKPAGPAPLWSTMSELWGADILIDPATRQARNSRS